MYHCKSTGHQNVVLLNRLPFLGCLRNLERDFHGRPPRCETYMATQFQVTYLAQGPSERDPIHRSGDGHYRVTSVLVGNDTSKRIEIHKNGAQPYMTR